MKMINKNHELVGSIIFKELRKVYNKDSEYCGNSFYRIRIINESEKKEDFLFVYPNLVRPEIFHSIEKSRYVDQRYLFFYEKKPNRLVLHDWRELSKE